VARRERTTVLAFDFGLKRIGVAVGNLVSRTAEPLATLPASDGEPDWNAVKRLITDWQPGLLVVGVPYNMDGSPGVLAQRAIAFAAALGSRHELEVATVDERLSSREAEEALRRQRRQGSLGRRIRREDVDREAARVLLRQWLDGRNH
jgi:putative Holliday junction resolvase